jgi:transposase
MALHYGVAVMPARPYKPGDKAKVENAVLLAERWIIAALRHRRFQTLPELNEAIAELLEKLNQRPFRKREGSRASLFAELDRPALQPLPAQRYELAYWKTVRASIDYHVEVERHYYSVRISWPAKPWKPGTLRLLWKSFMAETAWPLTRAATPPIGTPPSPNTCPRVTRLIGNGVPRG